MRWILEAVQKVRSMASRENVKIAILFAILVTLGLIYGALNRIIDDRISRVTEVHYVYKIRNHFGDFELKGNTKVIKEEDDAENRDKSDM